MLVFSTVRGVFVLYFDEYGKGNEEIIVFLHGYGNVHSFRKQYCLQEYYHIFVPHLLGFGNSANEIFDINDQVKRLAEFTNQLDRRVNLVGFSLGATVAIKMLSEYPHFFKKAILVSPYLLGDKKLLKEQTEGAMKGAKIMRNRLLGPVAAVLSGVPKEIRKDFVCGMRNIKDETVVNAFNNGVRLDKIKKFSEVSIPVIVVVGGKEHDIMKDSARGLCSLNNNCNYVEYKDAMHNVPTKFSGQFNELVMSTFK